MALARTHQRGLSLIEIVITVAVLAVILAAAMPSVGIWLDNTRIRNVADSLQNGLQTARGEAIRRNQPVSFWLVAVNDPTQLSNDCSLSDRSGSWVVSLLSPVAHCAVAPSTTTSPMLVTGRAVGDAGGRVSVTAVYQDNSTAANVVTFNGFGRITNTDTAIHRIDVTGAQSGTNYRKLRIDISSSGQVRMCDLNVTDANDPRYCPTT